MDPQSPHIQNWSQRTLVSRSSYGGGFNYPKKPPISQYSSKPGRSSPKEISHRINRYKANLGESTNALESIELELEKARDEALALSAHLNSRARNPRILHVDPPHYHAPPAAELDHDFTLEELGALKERQNATLFTLEAEYNRRKEAERALVDTTRPRPQVYKNPSPRALSRKSPLRSQYEARFERYREEQSHQRSLQRPGFRGSPLRTRAPGADQSALLKWMFSKLDKDNSGTVDKLELMQEFHRNVELAEVFGLREQAEHPNYMQQFNLLFESIGASNKHEISLDEFLRFFTQNEKEKAPTKTLKSKSPTRKATEEPVCLLTSKQMTLLETVFQETDLHQDLALPRNDYLHALKNDSEVAKILSVDAVQLTPYQALSLETMLDFIENDWGGDLTWNQFADYFFSRPTVTQTTSGTLEDPALDEIALPVNYMNMIKTVFNSLLPKGGNKVSTHELVTSLREDPQVKGFLSITAREPPGESTESVGDILTRLLNEARSLITWGETLGYFSRRGKPKKARENTLAEKHQFVKLEASSKAQGTAHTQTEQDYESRAQHSLSVSPKARGKKVTFQATDQGKFSVTIPEGFSFDFRDKVKEKSIREQKFEEYMIQRQVEEEEHLKYQYRAKAVPSEVVVPKYESMLATQEARRLEVKRKSMELTKATEKPFSFYHRDDTRRKTQTPQPSQKFKAKPIPWACTVPLYQTMVTSEKAAREERISRAAQEKWRKASLPPRMERYEKLKLQQETLKSPSVQGTFKAKRPPNFAKLQGAFQQSLDANKKAKLATLPAPFSFDKTSGLSKAEEEKLKKDKMRTLDIDVLDEEGVARKKWGPAKAKSDSLLKRKPQIEPAITMKYRDMVAKRHRELQDSEKKKAQEAEEERKRSEKQGSLKHRVQSYFATEDRPVTVSEGIKKGLQESTKNYKAKLLEIKAKVDQRPLLAEQVVLANNKDVARKKTLLRVKQTLEKSKVDTRSYFTAEELDLIEQAEYERNSGKLTL